MTGEIVASRDEAVARAERIRAGIRSMAELQQDIADAYHARDWEALGYKSWDDYVTGEFGSLPRLNRGERRELVVNLRAEGLSTRAIAAAAGTGQTQVRRDLSSTEPDGSVEATAVTGVNGKTYEPRKPEPAAHDEGDPGRPEALPPKMSAPRRQPLTDAARQAGWELRKAVEKLEKLFADDRFPANKEKVAIHLNSHLIHAVETCQVIHDRINEHSKDTQW